MEFNQSETGEFESLEAESRKGKKAGDAKPVISYSHSDWSSLLISFICCGIK